MKPNLRAVDNQPEAAFVLKLALFLIVYALGLIAVYIAAGVISEWAVYLIPHPPR